MILPFIEGMKFREYSEKNGLYAFHITKVKTKVEKQEKRIMMEMCLMKKDLKEDELVIQEEDLSFTDEYLELTKDFYLGLPKKRNYFFFSVFSVNDIPNDFNSSSTGLYISASIGI